MTPKKEFGRKQKIALAFTGGPFIVATVWLFWSGAGESSFGAWSSFVTPLVVAGLGVVLGVPAWQSTRSKSDGSQE